jgi:hypothetical protein
MSACPSRLLCLDLQIDPANGLDPDPRAVFGARQLLAMGRRLGWTIAHVRRRTVAGGAIQGDVRTSGLRPLLSERVFVRAGATISSVPGLQALLEDWRDETVYVAAFDHVALMSCLLACYDHGPHLVVVEDAVSAGTAARRVANEAFRSAEAHLVSGATSISGILATARMSPVVTEMRRA